MPDEPSKAAIEAADEIAHAAWAYDSRHLARVIDRHFADYDELVQARDNFRRLLMWALGKKPDAPDKATGG